MENIQTKTTYFILTSSPDCRLENKGTYYLSETKGGGRLLYEHENKKLCQRWVDNLNENPFKEGYLTESPIRKDFYSSAINHQTLFI